MVFIFAASIISLGAVGFAQESLARFEPKQNRIKEIVTSLDLLSLVSAGKELKPILETSRNTAGSKFRNPSLFHLPAITNEAPSWARIGVGANTRAGYGFGRSGFYEIGDAGRYWLFVEDNDSKGAALKIQATEAGELILDYRANDGSSLFRFRQQSKNGLVFCQCYTKGNAVVTSGKSYDDFCLSNPELIRNQLTPLFQHIGLGSFPNRYADEVAESVLTTFQPIDPSNLEKFQLAIIGLDSRSFAKRESAMGLLEKNARDWRNIIQSSIHDDQYSTETRNRLKTTLDNSIKEQEAAVLEFATKEKLASDPSFLVWLLEESEKGRFQISIEAKDLLVTKLEELTKENHGEDLKAWRSLISQTKPATATEPFPTMTDQQLLEFDGPLEKAGNHIGKLVRLKVKDGDLMIDKKHWKKPFGGMSIEEVSKKVQDQMRELNLPEAWFAAGGRYPISHSKHPQVLFEAMANDLPHPPVLPNNMPTPPKTFNRHFIGDDLNAFLKMRTHKMTRVVLGNFGIPKAKKETRVEFNIRFSELKDDFSRIFSINETGDGAFTLLLEYPAQDTLIKIVQQKGFGSDKVDHLVVFDIRGPKMKIYKAKSFGEFKSKNAEYFDNLIAPVLGKLKIKIED